MADKVVTLHPQNQTDDNLYPRVLGKSVQAGTNIEIDPTANTISVAQSLVDTINGKQTKGDYVTNSTLANNYYTKSNIDSLLATKQATGDYALKSDVPTKTSQLTNNSGYLISSDLKTSVSVISNSDDTTSISVSVGGVSSSANTSTLKVGYAQNAHSIVDEQSGQGLTFSDIVSFNSKQDTILATGSSTKPVYFSKDGQVAKANTYAGGTKVTLNGNNMGGSSVSFYAPTSNGTAGYVLTSGSGTGVPPKWVDPSTISIGYANAIGIPGANYTKEALDNALNSKQSTLVSGTNLKTVNGTSLLGSGNIAVAGNVTINSIDIVYNSQNVDDGTFYNALTGHKAILGVYYVSEGTYDSYLYSCVYNYGYSDQDPEQTSYRFEIAYYNGSGLVELSYNETIRIIYID